MSTATELDLAIQQIDDLLTKLQATAPEATPSRANEPNTNSKDPWKISRGDASSSDHLSTDARGVQA